MMKKVLLSLLSLLLIMGTITAQEAPEKILKKAEKLLGKYNLDPTNAKDKLVEAKGLIDGISSNDAVSGMTKLWLTKGKIYNEIASKDATMLTINPEHKVTDARIAIDGYSAFKKAGELAQKKYEKKEITQGLLESVNYLNNIGINLYGTKDFVNAFESFEAVLDIRKILKAQGNNSALEKEEDYQNQLYLTGLSALNADKVEMAEPYFQELYDANFDKPAVYEALYKIKAKNDKDAAVKILETGRAKHPDDASLLFAEINHYLIDGKLDVLTDKLKQAIEKEPENKSLYSTLGNVYDNLFQKAQEAGDGAKAQEHFDNALKYYNEALTKDEKFFDAIYSIGALYYNKAAAMTNDLKVLEDDYSSAGLKKYDAKKAEVFAMFDKALPYFKKSEGINPNDKNTLIAIREIAAKKEDMDVYNEFKKRLETLEAGGTNETSFFK